MMGIRMKLWDRTTLVLGLWFLLLLAGALSLKTVWAAAERIPERMPMMVILPGTEQRDLETALAGLGEDFSVELIPRETGLDRLRERLTDGGAGVDTGILNDVPGNPVPDIFLVRTSDPRLYVRMSAAVQEACTAAQIQYDARALSGLAPVLTAGRALSAAVFLLMSVLACVSISDRFGAGASASFRPALLAALAGVAGVAGLLGALGFAAARRPDLWFGPYANLVCRFIRAARLDWTFPAEFLAGWFALVAVSAWMSRFVLRRASAGTLALIVTAALFLPPASPASAAPRDREADLKTLHDDVMRQIRAREAEYDGEQEKLKATRREAVDLAKKERRLFKKLEEADRALSKTRADLALLVAQLETIEKDIHSIQEQWNMEHTSIEHRRWLLARRLKTLAIVEARPDWLNGLFAYGDRSIPFQLREGLVCAAEADHRLIGAASARKAEIEKIQELLKAKEASLKAVQDKKLALERRQDRERIRRQELLQEVRGRKSAMDEMARRIEAEGENMKLLLTTLREQSLKLKEQLAVLRKEFEDKKGLLAWPLAGPAIRSVRPYGKIFDETIGSWRINKGIDILTETNQSVRAVSKGEVVFADFFGRMGNMVILSHGGDYYTLYAHLSEIGVNLGGRVEHGEPVGRAGNTGLLEDSAILHFEIRQGSQAVDPEHWLGRRH